MRLVVRIVLGAIVVSGILVGAGIFYSMKTLERIRDVIAVGEAAVAVPLEVAAVDPDVTPVLLDSSDRESFLAVQADAMGRLFVGGREALFVYEPKGQGGFEPRRELYRFPDHSWIYDIAIRGDDVYVLTVSALYVLPGAVTQREGLAPRKLVWGVPLGHVHQCFHGMALGPEGDIYFAMGDPLWYYGDFNRPDHWGYWTFFSRPEGTATPYHGVGGVFRCRPDGSGLTIVARGLRNSCGLTFDEHWNLFTNDNDHESMPAQYVPGRLIHVTDHAYFSWPRGWLTGKSPDRADLLETMFEGMGRAVPVGQAYYSDSLLPNYRGNLLVARWCIRSVTRYPLEQRGASFRASEYHVLDGRDLARPVGLGVGCGGRIFVTIAYMAQNEASPVYRSDLVMLTRANAGPAQAFDPFDVAKAPDDKLYAQLSSPDWSRRQIAHQELLRRAGLAPANAPASNGAAARLAKTAPNDPARECLAWLACAADSAAPATLLEHADPAVRLQAARALARFRTGQVDRLSPDRIARGLNDENPQIRHAMLLALFDSTRPLAEFSPAEFSPVVDAAQSDDTYLRQAAALLLAEKAAPAEVARLCESAFPKARLAGVLAAGFRLTLPPATAAASAELPLEKLNSEEAYTVQYADAKIDLRTLGRIGNYTVADHWKAGQHAPEQENLFSLLLARLDDEHESVRLQAAHFLSLLNDARSEPGVLRVAADTEERRLLAARVKGVGKIWAAGPFPDGDAGFAKVHPPEQGPIDLAANYSSAGAVDDGTGQSERAGIRWQILEPSPSHYNFAKAFGIHERTSCYGYVRLESAARQRIQLLVGSDDGARVWHNGNEVWTDDATRGALPFQDAIPLLLEPGGNDILIRVRNRTGETGLYLHVRSLAEVSPGLPDKLDIAGLAERLASAAKEAGGDQPPPRFLQVDWPAAVAAGDAERGRKLFETIGCAKCHAVKADGAGGGPSLADAARRFTLPFLVESVLLPNKQVSPVFRATQAIAADGTTHLGLLIGETEAKLDLLLNDGQKISLDKSQIEERELTQLSPMPRGIVKQPDELQDILAYLLAPEPAK